MSQFRQAALPTLLFSSLLAAGCGAPANQPLSNTANTNANSNANVAVSNTNTNSQLPEFAEPTSYQAVIALTLQTMGETQNTSMPPLNAVVARSGENRAMQFALPTNEKIIYLEKGAAKYIVLPNRQQYAELTEDALGFEIRRMMTPEQIVQQLRSIPGVKAAGEEEVAGRTVQKFVYGSVSSTGTQAGNVETESYFLIDKTTGLPIRSEIVSQSTSGGNVQGIKGVRLLTEMSEIAETPDAGIFEVPAEYKKIDPEQVKAQANMLFNAAAAVIGQLVRQAAVTPSPAGNNAPTAANANR